MSKNILPWERFYLRTELRLAHSKIEVLLSKLSISNSKVDMLSYSIQEESLVKDVYICENKELKKRNFSM